VSTPADPVAIVQSLDADAIAARLDELAREEQALRVLLRSARARQKGQRQPPPMEARKGVAHVG
jgi:hypothetical protein